MLCLTLLAIAWWFATPASSQVVLDFRGHEGGVVRNGVVYFPHAYIHLHGVTEEGEIIDEAWGFTAANPGPWLLLGGGKGRLSQPQTLYRAESLYYGSVTLSVQQFEWLVAHLQYWREEGSAVYRLRDRNCITFVAEIAQTLGLLTPSTQTLSPNRFLGGLRDLNNLTDATAQ